MKDPKSKTANPANKKRRSVRFLPDPNCLALVDFGLAANKDFQPTVHGLVISESHGGCGIVVVESATPQFQQDLRCRVKVGNLNPLWACVRWLTPLGDGIFKIGLEFQE